MKEEQLLKLYELSGTVHAQREIAKCGIRSAHEALKEEASNWLIGYMQGQIRQYVKQVQNSHHLYREISAMIEEVESE